MAAQNNLFLAQPTTNATPVRARRNARTSPGGVLIEQGQELRALILVLSGSASVIVDGVKRATLYPGDFAGEMSFITGRLTSADVIADEPVRYMIWSAKALERLYQRDADMKNTVHSIIGFDMASKLAR